MASVRPQHDIGSQSCLACAPIGHNESGFLFLSEGTSVLLSLPGEIRSKIYEYILTGETFIFTKRLRMQRVAPQDSKGNYTAFLRTSRQIYREALPMYHIFTEFQIDGYALSGYFPMYQRAKRQMAKFKNIGIILISGWEPHPTRLQEYAQLRHLRIDMGKIKLRWGALGIQIKDMVDETTGVHRNSDMLPHSSILIPRVRNMRAALASMRGVSGILKSVAEKLSVSLEFNTEAFIGPLQDDEQYEKLFCSLKLTNDDIFTLSYRSRGIDYTVVQTACNNENLVLERLYGVDGMWCLVERSAPNWEHYRSMISR